MNGKVGWAPPSYLKKVEKGDSTEGESDSDDEYLGLPGYVDPDKDLSADSGISVAEGHNSTPAERKFIVPEIEFQEYKAIDSYEAQGDGQVSFEEGDIIQVLDKIEDGWWFVAKGLEEGWVPCSYLEPLKVGQEDDTISSLDIEKYVTVEKYTAEEDDELSFPKGVTVDVLQKSLDGWWLIKHDGKTALAPATFLVRKEPSENSPPTLRKASTVTAMEPLEEEQENEEEEKREKEEVRTSRLYQQPPRRHSVRRRISNRTTRLLASNPPFLNASASHVAPDTLKQSNSAKATETTRESPNHSQLKRKPRVRKISEQVAPTQSPVSIEAFLPGQRKASIDSGLPILIKTAGSSFANGQRETPTDVAGSPTSNLDSDTEDHEYFNIDPQAYLRERQHQQNLKHLHSNMSPTTSDSEIDVSRSWRKPMKQGRKGVQSRIKRWEQGSHGPSSDSEDSITSPPTSIRPPIATPRTNKPELKPKPKMASIPQMPPRPHVSQINRARSKQPPKELQIEQPLQRPPRPRVTEIRRARVDKASRSPTPLSTPTPPPPTSITEGRHSGANSRARQQTNSKLKSMGKGGLSASMGSLLEAGSIGEQSQKNASSGSTASSLAPPNPDHRQRGYYSDTESNTPPSNSIPLSDCPVPSELAECSTAMNQQMAETLIKYIMSSQDSGLKSALLDCIKGNNEILNSIRE